MSDQPAQEAETSLTLEDQLPSLQRKLDTLSAMTAWSAPANAEGAGVGIGGSAMGYDDLALHQDAVGFDGSGIPVTTTTISSDREAGNSDPSHANKDNMHRHHDGDEKKEDDQVRRPDPPEQRQRKPHHNATLDNEKYDSQRGPPIPKLIRAPQGSGSTTKGSKQSSSRRSKEIPTSAQQQQQHSLPKSSNSYEEDESLLESSLMKQSADYLADLKAEVVKLRKEFHRTKENNVRLQQANATAGESFLSLNTHAQSLTQTVAQLQAELKQTKEQLHQVNLAQVELRDELQMKQASYIAEVQTRLQYQGAFQEVMELVQSQCRDTKLVEQILGIADRVDGGGYGDGQGDREQPTARENKAQDTSDGLVSKLKFWA